MALSHPTIGSKKGQHQKSKSRKEDSTSGLELSHLSAALVGHVEVPLMVQRQVRAAHAVIIFRLTYCHKDKVFLRALGDRLVAVRVGRFRRVEFKPLNQGSTIDTGPLSTSRTVLTVEAGQHYYSQVTPFLSTHNTECSGSHLDRSQ
jgi:hypothetical protein